MTRVLWLTPNKPENISVGRQRITAHLEERGFTIDLQAGDLPTLRKALYDDEDYDVVVGTTRAGAIVGTAISVLRGRPLVVDHIDPIRQFEETSVWPLAFFVKHFEHLAFRRSAHTLYVYPEEASRVHRFASSASETNLGVEYDRFADPSQEVIERVCERLSRFDLHENVAIYVGGLEPIYHIRELVDSIDHLDNWSLLVLGSGSESEYVEQAAEVTDVTFLGTVPHEDVPGYLYAADVGVSLVDDPNTLKVLEYGAAGLPTVQLAGRAEARLETAVEYCEADPKSISTAIERTRGRSVDELREITQDYSWESIADQYASVIAKVVNSAASDFPSS